MRPVRILSDCKYFGGLFGFAARNAMKALYPHFPSFSHPARSAASAPDQGSPEIENPKGVVASGKLVDDDGLRPHAALAGVRRRAHHGLRRIFGRVRATCVKWSLSVRESKLRQLA